MVDDAPARLTVRYPNCIPVDDGLELRLVQEGDAEELFRATEANRAYLREWLPWVDATRSVADIQAFVARSLEQVRLSDGFQARIVSDGDFAGLVGFLYHDWTNLRTEIGYWLQEGFQGRGLMTRSTKALVDYAFDKLGLHRVEIRAATENRRSRAVPERLGFVQEGVLREFAWLNDRFVDLVVYAKLRAEPGPPEAPRSL